MKFINKTVEELKNFNCEYKPAYAMAYPFPGIYFNNFADRNALKEISKKEFPHGVKSSDPKFNAVKETISFNMLPLLLHYLNKSIN